MKTLEVKTKSRRYNVCIERGGIENIGEAVKRVRGVSKAVIVSDTNAAPLYADCVLKSLKAAGFDAYAYVFEAGEKSKTTETYLNVIRAFAEYSLTRDSVVIALGGGVVGDVSGFAAATYMRGIDCVQIPTTLLAAIDSAIGGKTGVDLPEGKNLLGAIRQPALVFIDPGTFKTLPGREWKNGLGEGLKYAVLKGGRIYEMMSKGISENNFEEFLTLAAAAKIEIVNEDENETGKRKLLNLGHTLGHAAETLSGFTLPHGEAVAAGVQMMATAAFLNKDMAKTAYDDICALVDMYGFDVCRKCAYEDAMRAVKRDKKLSDTGKISIIKIKEIGDCFVDDISFSDFALYVRGAFEK